MLRFKASPALFVKVRRGNGGSAYAAASLRLQPGRVIVLLFELVERVGMAQSQPDVVEPFEQAVLAEGIDLERSAEAAAVGHLLLLERDGEPIAGNRLRILEQLFNVALAQPHQHDAVLAGVREEDIGEARRNDHAESVVA